MNAPDGLPEQVGHGEDGQLGEVVLLGHRDGVGDDHLLEQAAGQPFDRRRAARGAGEATGTTEIYLVNGRMMETKKKKKITTNYLFIYKGING